MENVKIEIHIKVVHERNWSEATTLAEANVSAKSTYDVADLLLESKELIADAQALFESRLKPAIREHEAATERKAQQDKERAVNADA